MQAVKTAISIEKELFEKAEKMARAMKVTRSRLFVIALQDFLEHQKNRELLAQLNAACAEEPNEAEGALLRKSRKTHRRLVEGEW